MKRFFSALLVLAIVLSMACIPTFADNNDNTSEIIALDDGYYLVTEISEINVAQPYAFNDLKTKAGTKTASVHSSNGDTIATVALTGVFQYDGKECTAIDASYEYTILNTSWKYDSGRSYCSGSTAYAEITLSRLLARDIVFSVTLTCSPTGVLS